MTIHRLKELVKDDFEAINALITDRIQSEMGLIDEMVQHIIQSGGKRLRPLLVLLTSHACGYQGTDHITLAAMIEFFHTATLLHDDVIDESSLRRGRETANEIWGSKASILVGDCLYTQSVELTVKVNHSKILNLMAETALKLTCGEVKQLSHCHNTNLTMDEYFDIIRAKTALLFAASATIGGLLSNVDEKIEQSLYAYGLHLGNAFQLIDDAMDYCADSNIMGKNIGDDLAEGKVTLPLIHALKHSTPAQQQLIKKNLAKGGLEHLDEILSIIKETKAIEFTHQHATVEIDHALSALQIIPDSVYKEALIELAQFALQRKH